MCRLLCLPPKFPRNEAVRILLEMEGTNTEGCGSAYLNDKGEFVVNKWALSTYQVLARNYSFLTHLNNHNGWTIVHQRAASRGSICKENSHPFICNNHCVAHNGTFRDYRLIRMALSKYINFTSWTDSEVAGHLIDMWGAKRFSEEIDWAGVFIALNRKGGLTVIKTSGDLEMSQLKNGTVLIGSELNNERYENKAEALIGYYMFDKDGKYIKHKRSEKPFNNFRSVERSFGYGNDVKSFGRSNLPSHYYSQIYDGAEYYPGMD